MYSYKKRFLKNLTERIWNKDLFVRISISPCFLTLDGTNMNCGRDSDVQAMLSIAAAMSAPDPDYNRD
jgi:hypothetical protein